jgi:hypothetical protein
MTKIEEDFMMYFNVRNISQSKSSPKSIQSFGYSYLTSEKDYNYYRERGEEFLDIEMSRKGWDELMRYYRMNVKLNDLEVYESEMRRKYPAVKDAHEKYLMLMELYR